MVAIRFRFPAGRYHANPWGRHVNEADVEWPPAPWRILRALIATWHRKLDAGEYPESILEALVDKLAATPPAYRLPRATRSHSRHYMPVRSGKTDKPVLIFDAFVRVDPRDSLDVVWSQAPALSGDESELLDTLLRDIGFLGRAESWVEAERVADEQVVPNCTCGELSTDPRTGEVHEPVRLIAAAPATDYSPWREAMIQAHGRDAKKLKKAQRQLLVTLPERLLDALRTDTSDLQAAGWSCPPGARFVTYQRPYGCFTPQRRDQSRQRIDRDAQTVTTARLALAGKPLPRIEDAVRIGELTRKAAIKLAETVQEGEPVPSVLSGHDRPRDNRHGHAFYLPEANANGRIDHVLVHASDGLEPNALTALDRITRIWRDEGQEWQVLLEQFGNLDDLDGLAYLTPSTIWESVTPYLHPWHRKKKFTVEDQIRRECRERHLPEPELERLPTIRIQSRDRRPVHFYRFRDKPGLTQPDTQGSFWRLTFPEPVPGPVALGFGCHFGLGCFRAVSGNASAAEYAGG